MPPRLQNSLEMVRHVGRIFYREGPKYLIIPTRPTYVTNYVFSSLIYVKFGHRMGHGPMAHNVATRLEMVDSSQMAGPLSDVQDPSQMLRPSQMAGPLPDVGTPPRCWDPSQMARPLPDVGTPQMTGLLSDPDDRTPPRSRWQDPLRW